MHNRKFNPFSIPQVPLPSFFQLIRSFLLPLPSENSLSCPWERTGESSIWFSSSTYSLAAIATLRLSYIPSKTISVWVPDYFCNAALIILRTLPVNITFYPIDETLKPCEFEFNNLNNESPPDIFIIVHYLGKPTPISDNILDKCKQNNTWLIEDATHVLLPVTGVGESGEFVLYSPHKQLPIPDGALLVITSRLFSEEPKTDDILLKLQNIRNLFYTGFTFSSLFQPYFWLLKRLLQSIGFRRSPLPISLDHQVSNNSRFQTPFISTLSLRLLKRLISSISNVSTSRILIYQYWKHFLDIIIGTTPHSSNLNYTPYLFRYQLPVDEPNNEKSLTKFLDAIECDTPFTTWPDLAQEVLANPIYHSEAIRQRRNSYYLPLHTSISSFSIRKHALKSINHLLSDWSFQILDEHQWYYYFSKCKFVNNHQTIGYGNAKSSSDGWRPERYCIYDENNQAIAIFQALFKGIQGIGYVVRINRGPLLIGSWNSYTRSLLSCKCIAYIKNILRTRGCHYLRIAPELIQSATHVTYMSSLGYNKLSHPLKYNYTSGLIDLSNDEDSLFLGLKAKWRNMLRKSQKQGLTHTIAPVNHSSIDSLVYNYRIHQNKRQYSGIPENFFLALNYHQSKDFSLFLFNAFIPSQSGENMQYVGQIVATITGNTATYLIGSMTEKGRLVQANTYLLWHVILHAKLQGCDWFDVGGLGDGNAVHAASFKRGLNSIEYTLVGEWSKFL